MKKLIIAMSVSLCTFSTMNAQGLLKSIGQRAKNSATTSVQMKADRTISGGIDNVLSGRIFGKKKDTSKGTETTLISYINSEYGFKGQYPNGYTRSDEEDGMVSFTSRNGDISVIYMGSAAEASIDEEYNAALEQINSEYELLDSSKKSDGYVVKYNMGGTCAAVRMLRKGNNSATVMVTYPEAEATAYKKLIGNILDGVKFFR